MADIQTSFRRREKKYLITPAQQHILLDGMAPHTQADRYGRYSLCNIYYDTDDWRLIRASIEKPAYKEKLRVRSYGVPAPDSRVFVELKKKYCGVVYKRRITAPLQLVQPLLTGALPCGSFGQIGREIGWFQKTYGAYPRVFIGYDRTAYAGTDDPALRITFDTNLRWRDTELDLTAGSHGALLLPPDRVLMEIKMPGACPLWLSRLLAETGIFPASFSKYGVCYRAHILKGEHTNRLLKEVTDCA